MKTKTKDNYRQAWIMQLDPVRLGCNNSEEKLKQRWIEGRNFFLTLEMF